MLYILLSNMLVTEVSFIFKFDFKLSLRWWLIGLCLLFYFVRFRVVICVADYFMFWCWPDVFVFYLDSCICILA